MECKVCWFDFYMVWVPSKYWWNQVHMPCLWDSPCAQKWKAVEKQTKKQKKNSSKISPTYFPPFEIFHFYCYSLFLKNNLLSVMHWSSARDINQRDKIAYSHVAYILGGTRLKYYFRKKWIMHIPQMLLCECKWVCAVAHNSLMFINSLVLFCCQII